MHELLKKDILDGVTPNKRIVILHGCNCFHTMGAGIAKYLKQNFPVILQVDKTTGFGDKGKLGTFSTAAISDNLHILNCYTQYDYRRGKKVHADYTAIESCFKGVNLLYDFTWEIRLPKIGCGLAGGNWGIVSGLLENTLGHKNVKVYFL